MPQLQKTKKTKTSKLKSPQLKLHLAIRRLGFQSLLSGLLVL